MGEVSGLPREQRIRCRDRVVQAAELAYANKATVHYTQKGKRWNGIRNDRDASLGSFPHWADCSSFVTWCLWNGMFKLYGLPDTVNGTEWGSGFTGTLRQHGKKVPDIDQALRGDLVFYDGHVALVTDRLQDQHRTPMVISHGSEKAPYHLKWNYRNDFAMIRRYI